MRAKPRFWRHQTIYLIHSGCRVPPELSTMSLSTTRPVFSSLMRALAATSKRHVHERGEAHMR